MRRLPAAALAALAAASVQAAAVPYLGYVYPSGLQAGTTNRILVGGQFLRAAKDGWFSGSGVRVVEIENVPDFPPPGSGQQRQYLQKWLRAIAKGDRARPPLPENADLSSWRSNRWWNALGDLDDQKLAIVERDLYTPRNALQMSPSLRQRLLVTVVADASAEPGVREFRMWGPNGLSAPRPFEITSAARTEEPLFAAPFRPRPRPPLVTALPAVLDGEILPGETDLWQLALKHGQSVTLCVRGREFQPYVGDAVPGFFNPVLRVVGPDGREIAVADDDFYHPDPVLTFVSPAEGAYRVEIRDVLYRGREDFVYTLSVAEGTARPDVRDVPVRPFPPCALPPECLVTTFAGCVGEPGCAVTHELDLAHPGTYVIDVLARRAGSPLDAAVEVTDVNGRVLARLTDVTNAVFCGTVAQGESDPVGRVSFESAGRYALTVTDEQGKGGPEWTYALRVHRPAPRCEVWLSPSGYALRPGSRADAKVTVMRRDGCKGAVRLCETPCVRFEPSVIPEGSNTLRVAVISKARMKIAPERLSIAAEVTDGVRQVSVPVHPADEVSQAFAWDHLLPARQFLFIGLPGPGSKRRFPRQ